MKPNKFISIFIISFFMLISCNENTSGNKQPLFPDLNVYVYNIHEKTFGGTEISGIVANNSKEIPPQKYDNITISFECFKGNEFIGAYDLNIEGSICKDET